MRVMARVSSCREAGLSDIFFSCISCISWSSEIREFRGSVSFVVTKREGIDV